MNSRCDKPFSISPVSFLKMENSEMRYFSKQKIIKKENPRRHDSYEGLNQIRFIRWIIQQH